METLLTVANYLLWIFPGLILIALFLFFIKPSANLRIIVYIFTFVLMRDAMTPLGLWSLGKGKAVLWIRLSIDLLSLILLGIFSLLIMLALTKFDKENCKHLIWFQNSKLMGLLFGTVGRMVVVLPLFVGYQGELFKQAPFFGLGFKYLGVGLGTAGRRFKCRAITRFYVVK